MKNIQVKSIRTKITLWTGVCLLLLAVALIIYSVVSLQSTMLKAAQETVTKVAQSTATRIEIEVQTPLDVARTLAQLLKAMKTQDLDLTQDQVNTMLEQVLRDNPEFLGVYILWEPNTFDDKEAEYVWPEAHAGIGRFVSEVGGDEAWYLCPKRTKEECVLEPFFYSVQGVDVLMTSLVVPIVADGQFYGLVGVDVQANFLQELADEVDLYDGTAEAALIGNQGTLGGVTGRPELVGNHIQAYRQDWEEKLSRIQTGALVHDFRKDTLAVFVPIRIGNTVAPWSVNLNVPTAKVTAQVATRMWQLIGIGLLLTMVALALLWLAAGQIANPISRLTAVARRVGDGDLTVQSPVETQDEIGQLAGAFNSMTAQLRQLIQSLEQRVTARTKRLETVATFSERIGGILDLETLLARVVTLIKDNLGYYHAHIYLLDDTGDKLVVAAGSGKAGAEMKAQGHNIPLAAPTSLVARAARSGQIVAVDNVRESEDWLPNPLLPNTYAEMAVPIMIKKEVVGVLDVQEDAIGGLDEADESLLHTLAGQIAAAIRNARLFAEVEISLAEARDIQQRYVEQAWDRSRVARQGASRVQFSLGESTVLTEAAIAEARRQALAQKEPATVAIGGNEDKDPSPDSQPGPPVTHHALVAPVTLQNTAIGNLQLYDAPDRKWTENELVLVNAVIDQVAQTAESLRLFNETQERASREQLVGQISNKMRQANNMKDLMQVTVAELSRVLGPARTFVRLAPEAQLGTSTKKATDSSNLSGAPPSQPGGNDRGVVSAQGTN